MGEIKNMLPASHIRNTYNSMIEALKVTLNINGSVKKIFGEWDEKAFDTIYQADTDGIVSAYAFVSGVGKEALLIGITDENTPPTQHRCGAHAVPTVNMTTALNGFCMPVKKGDYWKIYSEVFGIVIPGKLFWLPIGE